MRDVYANVVLKDNKLMFYWVGDQCESIDDFYKDFYYSGEEVTKGYRLVTQKMKSKGNAGFDEATEWMKRFPLHENFKGDKPY